MVKKISRISLILSLIMAQLSCVNVKNHYADGDILVVQPGPEEGIDAYVENWPGDNYPNRNWGDYEAFTAVAWTAKGEPLTVRCFLKFNLKKIPAKTKIKKATLSLYAVSTPGIGTGHSTLSGSNEFELLRVTSPWDENTVTWNTQPYFTSENRILLPGSENDLQDYLDIDVTKMIQEMISKPSENYGMMIRLVTEEYYRRIQFGSSDNKDISKHPKLVIEF